MCFLKYCRNICKRSSYFEDVFNKKRIVVQIEFDFNARFKNYNYFKFIIYLHVIPWEIKILHSS